MTYLELCQMVARESGTVSGTLPTTVSGQTGRLGKIVSWTAAAWTRIQNSRSSWRWMRAEFGSPDCVTTSGSARYTAASWNLSRHAEWINEEGTLTIYDETDGVSDETPLAFMEWTDYRRAYERGTQTSNRPVHYSISPANELCFGPKPDDTYVVRGEYRKTPQTLAANSDTPEMPSRFHEIIAWYGLILLSGHDEGEFPLAIANQRYRDMMGDLMRDQLPRISIGSALA